MGTFLAVMFCLFIVVVFIALVILLGVAATAFGEKFYDYLQDVSEEYFNLKRKKVIQIQIRRKWASEDKRVEIDLFGIECVCGSVAEMVAWLKEQGVE